MAAIRVTAEAPRTAQAISSTSRLTVATASLTRTAAITGKAAVTVLRSLASRSGVPPSGQARIASEPKGAPRKALGEKIITEFSASVRHSTTRKLATIAVTSRPSTLTVTLSPSFRCKPSAILPSKETRGGPA